MSWSESAAFCISCISCAWSDVILISLSAFTAHIPFLSCKVTVQVFLVESAETYLTHDFPVRADRTKVFLPATQSCWYFHVPGKGIEPLMPKLQLYRLLSTPPAQPWLGANNGIRTRSKRATISCANLLHYIRHECNLIFLPLGAGCPASHTQSGRALSASWLGNGDVIPCSQSGSRTHGPRFVGASLFR